MRAFRTYAEYPQQQRQAMPNLSNSKTEICFASLRNATYSSQLSNKLHLSDVHATPAHVGRAPASRTHTHTTRISVTKRWYVPYSSRRRVHTIFHPAGFALMEASCAYLGRALCRPRYESHFALGSGTRVSTRANSPVN